MRKTGKSVSTIRFEMDRASRQRAERNRIEAARTAYRTEPGGRLISFNREWWTDKDIADHMAELERKAKCPGDALSAPISTRAQTTRKANKTPNLGETTLLLLVFGSAALLILIAIALGIVLAVDPATAV